MVAESPVIRFSESKMTSHCAKRQLSLLGLTFR